MGTSNHLGMQDGAVALGVIVADIARRVAATADDEKAQSQEHHDDVAEGERDDCGDTHAARASGRGSASSSVSQAMTLPAAIAASCR